MANNDIKVFNNLDAGELAKGDGLKGYDGWNGSGRYDNDKINKIHDTVEGGGIGYFKLGTSIPTPFARIFMFRNAFNRLGANIDDRETIYGKLVSECLDFLEFIYHFGSDIEVKKWSFKNDVDLLLGKTTPAGGAATGGAAGGEFNLDDLLSGAASAATAAPAAAASGTVTGHVLLGECLQNQRSELGGIENIYLIYYKGQLMGGTSPFTLVFTSPNWHRHKNCGQVKGDAGNELFPNYQDSIVKATPLHLRDPKFVLFLLTYRRAYTIQGQDNSLLEYIKNALPYISNVNPALKQADDQLAIVPQANVRIAFEKKYTSLTCNDEPVNLMYSEGSDLYLPLCSVAGASVAGEKNDYALVPDYQQFTVRDENDTEHTITNVLALTDAGKQGARYVGGRPWNPNDRPDANIVDTPLWERVLPGAGNHQQPFITVNDLFEDCLIRLPYTLNSDRFETYVQRNWNFLLPIKKLFFSFFKKERLAEWLTVEATNDNTQVTFTLRLPIAYTQVQGRQEYLDVKKVYKASDIKDMRGGSWFAMAMFPTYRVMGADADNNYTIMAGNGREQVDLKFYNVNDLSKDLGVKPIRRPDDIGSQFYRIEKSAFDFIEVTPALANMARPVHALIIPKFVPAYLDDTESNWEFSIDFGTTNTYIAARNATDPETFEITSKDMQVAYLDRLDLSKGVGSEEFDRSIAASGVAPFHDAANREFAPIMIGSEGIASYPFQTVTCESNLFKNNDGTQEHLFSHLSIGYNLNNEEFSQNYVYRTDIKWAPGKEKGDKCIKAKRRIALYCEQIAWMLKNKVALSSTEQHHVGRRFKVFYTYPCSMSKSEVDALQEYWSAAFGDSVVGISSDRPLLKKLTESEAPYYYLTRKGDVSKGKNFLNVDIGGGTTDMFFVINDTTTGRTQKKSYYTSMRFAGNDLWGDGVDGTAKLTNGFYQKVKAGLPFMADEILKQEKLVISNPESTMTSADTMAYLFRNDDPKSPKIPTLIQSSNEKLFPLLIVHFGALMYHVAMILNEKNWELPKTINLTGMGSKYVHIIGSAENITSLAGLLLKTFTGMPLPDGFTVTYSKENAKQVTAQGALLSEQGRQLIEGTPEEFKVYGASPVTPGTDLTYGDTRQNTVRTEVLNEYQRFIDVFLKDTTIVNTVRQNYHNADISDWLVKGLEGKAEESYITVSESFTDDKDKHFIEETLFFWPLKNAIYELSKEA